MNIQEIKTRINRIATSNNNNHFQRQNNRRVNKSRLPTPLTFYKQLGLELKGKTDWRMAKCPFHDDKHASLGVNTAHGGFKCHACGESGDMLAFYMKFKNIDFKTACTELGIWEEY